MLKSGMDGVSQTSNSSCSSSISLYSLSNGPSSQNGNNPGKNLLLIKEISNQDTTKMKELVLDRYCCTDIASLGLSRFQFPELEFLSLSGVGLVSLEHFPCLPNLKKLELSNNKISGGLQFLKEAQLDKVLVNLNLSKNQIRRISDLEPLSFFEKLQYLNLVGCEVTLTPDYKKAVLSLLPSLVSLDGSLIYDKDITDDEVEEVEEIFQKSDSPKSSPPPQHGKLFFLSQNLNDSHYSDAITNLELPNLDAPQFDIPNVEEILQTSEDPESELSNKNAKEEARPLKLQEDEAALSIKLLQGPIADSDESDESDEEFQPSESEEEEEEEGEDEEDESGYEEKLEKSYSDSRVEENYNYKKRKRSDDED